MTAEQIKQSISLVDYVRSCGIELKAHGKNDFIGHCPFHEDDTASFVVTPAKQVFHCFGCNKGGSIIDFIIFRENVDSKQAIKILADQLEVGGSRLVEKPPTKNLHQLPTLNHQPSLSPERGNQLLEKVISFYEKTFADVPEGRQYFESQGISDAGLYSSHRIGYCNGTLTSILPEKSSIWDELKELGILLANHQERFTGCVMVPIFDTEGGIVTLYGRYTGSHSAKNNKTHMFLPGRSKGIWNIQAIKTYAKVIVVESIIDGLSLQIAGHHNVIAINGNSSFNNGEVDLFREQGVHQVSFLLDGDNAGKEAAQRLKGRIDSYLSCELKTLPDNHDPNSYLLEHGAETLARWLTVDGSQLTEKAPEIKNASGKNPLCASASLRETTQDGFAVTYGLRRYEIHGLEKGVRKLKATIRIEHAGKLHVDTMDLYSARARRSLAQDICRIFEQPAETIEADINKLLLACEAYNPEEQKSSTSEPDPVSQMTAKDRKEAEAFGKHPDLIKQILADYEKCGLVGEKHNKLLCYLAAISRKVDEPLSVLILSSSGAGKTALQDATLAFCPPEDVIKLTSLSGKALFYKDEFSLKHKILALEEGDGAEDASYAIRNLISSGVLVIEATIKDILTGRMTTMENRVEGPTVVFLTTTDPNTDSETKSRFWIISVDESRQQTRAILAFQRQRHSLNGLAGDSKNTLITQKHQNFQRLLKSIAVVNPYAEYLGYSDDRLQGRRDQPKYLNLINTVALLRQMTKQTKFLQDNGKTIPYIEVELEDIKLANELTAHILGKSLDELSSPARQLLVLLDDYVDKRFNELATIDKDNVPSRNHISFSRREIRDFTGWTNTRLHIYLRELIDMEYVLIDSGRNNTSRQQYRLLYEGQGKDGNKFICGLKSVEDIRKEYEKDHPKP